MVGSLSMMEVKKLFDIVSTQSLVCGVFLAHSLVLVVVCANDGCVSFAVYVVRVL